MLLLALLSSAAYAQSGGAFTVTTLAGQAGLPGATDATGAAARFYNPSGLVADAKGNVYVADAGTNTIRKVTPSGVVTTFAGAAFDEGGSASNGGFVDGTGATARFLFGQAIIDLMGSNNLAIDADSNIYVADTLNKAIRKITPAAVVTTLSLPNRQRGWLRPRFTERGGGRRLWHSLRR
jgi:sugar lactone lactonase YvrE